MNIIVYYEYNYLRASHFLVSPLLALCHLGCMTELERPRAFNFCFKASLCELLGDEYLISWLLSARMYVSGTVMHITISPLSHTQLTYCPLRLPTRLVDGCVTKNLVRGQKNGPRTVFLQQKMVLGPNLPRKIWSMLENSVRLFIDWSAYRFMD